jgi:hypothetical protein
MDTDITISILASILLVLIPGYCLFKKEISRFIKFISILIILIIFTGNIYFIIKCHSVFEFTPTYYYHESNYDFGKELIKYKDEIIRKDNIEDFTTNIIHNIIPILLLLFVSMTIVIILINTNLSVLNKTIITLPLAATCCLFISTFRVNILSIFMEITNKQF